MLRAVALTVTHAMRIATRSAVRNASIRAVHGYDTASSTCAGAAGSANKCQGQCCMAPKTCSGDSYGDYTCA